MKRKNKRKKEEIAEDYCFVCKDGGLLRVCDYKDCLKAYHPDCVEKDDFFLKANDRWNCGWHSCFNIPCRRIPKFYCFCCPHAICGCCISVANFAQVRGNKGFCNHCLALALLIEENRDVDSDGGKVDFQDRESYEFLFMEYWEIIKEKEGLTSENVRSAKALLNKGKNCRFDLDEISEGEEENQLIISDYDMDDEEECKPARKRKPSKEKLHVMKREVKSKKKEFIRWGSKSLIEFLESIGKDTTKQLSQYEVIDIINKYIQENKLFHPKKKKVVICDARLQSVLRRKSVNKYKIYDLLEAHLAENLERSEEEEVHEVEYSSEDKDENVFVACKRPRKSSVDSRTHNKEVVLDVQRSCFASIVAKNIKLIYLKRTLVGELLKQPETFEGKVMGSFVRVKSDPNDYLQRSSHLLLQVTGIKKTSRTGEINSEILLQVSNWPTDIPICMLSDDEFTEEECEHLHQKVKDDLLKHPTVVELEQKARNLHEDITKHWIVRELALLQNLIDRANEKGWRRELFEYMERRQLLQTSSEQSRLLHEVPKVVAEVAALESASEDSMGNNEQGHNDLPKLIPEGTSEIPCDNSEGNETSCFLIGRTDTAGDGDVTGENSIVTIQSGSAGNKDGNGEANNGNVAEKNREEKELIERAVGLQAEPENAASEVSSLFARIALHVEEKQHYSGVSIPKEEQCHSEASVSEELSQQSCIHYPEVQQDDIIQGKPPQSIPEEKQHYFEASHPEELPPQSQDDSLIKEPHQSISEEKQYFSKAFFVEELPQQAHILAPAPQSVVTRQREPHQSSSDGERQNQPIEVEVCVKDRRASAVQVIELSDDDEQIPAVAAEKQSLEDLEPAIWHCVGPCGETKGPLSMSLLKRWSSSSSYALKFKVWKTGQSQEQAILMSDAIHQPVPRK